MTVAQLHTNVAFEAHPNRQEKGSEKNMCTCQHVRISRILVHLSPSSRVLSTRNFGWKTETESFTLLTSVTPAVLENTDSPSTPRGCLKSYSWITGLGQQSTFNKLRQPAPATALDSSRAEKEEAIDSATYCHALPQQLQHVLQGPSIDRKHPEN